MDNITSIGFTESHLLMISEILNSLNINPKIYILDNQNRFKSDVNFIKQDYEIIHHISDNSKNFIFGLAKPNGKKWLFDNFNLEKNKFINLIYNNNNISIYTEMGVGIRIEPNVCIAPKTIINDFVHINRGCLVGHHCEIGEFSSLNPGVKTGGNTKIGKCSEIGIGATILDNIKIGNNTIIGAGSVVTKNIPDNVIAFGNPCKIIRENE